MNYVPRKNIIVICSIHQSGKISKLSYDTIKYCNSSKTGYNKLSARIDFKRKREIMMDQNIIVYERCKNLRALGRESLRGRWGLGALGTLLYMVLAMVPIIILDMIFNSGHMSASWVGNVYSILISGPMTLGYTMFAISLFRKKEASPAEVFYGFERFGKAFGLYIVMSVFILLWTLLLIIPGIIAAFRYSMSFYILADNPDIGIMEALNESKRLMKGNKWKYFCLNLSFIGWGLLSSLTLGIGFLWLMPYIEVSIVAFYDIANGSLRSVSALARESSSYGGPVIDASIKEGDNGNDSTDPITVFKEDAAEESSLETHNTGELEKPSSEPGETYKEE